MEGVTRGSRSEDPRARIGLERPSGRATDTFPRSGVVPLDIEGWMSGLPGREGNRPQSDNVPLQQSSTSTQNVPVMVPRPVSVLKVAYYITYYSYRVLQEMNA